MPREKLAVAALVTVAVLALVSGVVARLGLLKISVGALFGA